MIDVSMLQEPEIIKGLLQVAAASILAAVVIGLSYVRKLDLERELSGAFVRGFIQVIAMGALIGFLFLIPLHFSAIVLAAMIIYASWESRKRGNGVPNAFRISLISLTVGPAIVIITMLWAGAIETTVRNLVPVGGMIIANAMRTNSLALDRFKDEINTNRDEIEAVLTLGVPPQNAINDYVTDSVKASLIPVVDSLRTLGVVYIPGMMSGMILAGSNPIYAAQYQFVIMGMIFAAGGLTSMTASLLVGNYAFTDAEQLKPFNEQQQNIIARIRNLF